MTQWISSDWHFGHSRIIKYCPQSRGHCKDVDDMNETIINNMNTVVKPDDTLYILGDVAFCKPDKAVEYLSRINCKKILIKGNHDTDAHKSVSFVEWIEKNNNTVFESMHDYLEIREEKSNIKVILMHFPIESWDGIMRGSIHLHGHLHSPYSEQLPKIRRKDIGVDSNFLKPYNLHDLVVDLTKINYKND